MQTIVASFQFLFLIKKRLCRNGESRSSGAVEFCDLEFFVSLFIIQTPVWVLIVSARSDEIHLPVVKGMLLSIIMHLTFKFICAAQRCELVSWKRQESTCSPSPDIDNFPLFRNTGLIYKLDRITLDLLEDCS